MFPGTPQAVHLHLLSYDTQVCLNTMQSSPQNRHEYYRRQPPVICKRRDGRGSLQGCVKALVLVGRSCIRLQVLSEERQPVGSH